MKALKRSCVLWLAVLCLLLQTASAAADAMTQADYETIIGEYRAAVTADTAEETLEHLKLLCAYYETGNRADSLEAYEGGTASVYYNYAKGIIFFSEEDYSGAWEKFGELQGAQVESGLADVPPLPDTTYYYEFSLAMLYCQAEDYENAFVALEAARTAEGASATACRNAKTAFAAALKQAAQKYCDAGDHTTAQSCYQLYAQYVSPFEGQALLKKCQEHSVTDAFAITGAEPVGPDTISLTWTGSSAAYRVCWSADPTGKTDVHAQIVEGKSATLTSLLPGTDYRITVEQAAAGSALPAALVQPAPGTEGIPETTVRTSAAGKYPSKMMQFVRALTVGIIRNDTLLKRVTPPQIIQEFPENYHRDSTDGAFAASDLASYRLCCLVSYRNQSGREIAVPVFCILRTEASGVYASEVTEFVFPQSGSDETFMFWVFLDDLLDMVEEAHSSLAEDHYTWEIYFDGQLFCKGDFSIAGTGK